MPLDEGPTRDLITQATDDAGNLAGTLQVLLDSGTLSPRQRRLLAEALVQAELAQKACEAAFRE